MNISVSIIIPVFNQLHFTKGCLDSLRACGAGSEVIVIDNGSLDGTSEFLASHPGITVISNAENLGCAAAWNQGVMASHCQWVAILNNDILLSPGWLEGLLAFAEEKHLDIVSPAFREGECNYDITTYARDFVKRMAAVSRMGVAQGICFMVRRTVFDTVGLFDENFRIGQFEDTDFYRRAAAAGFHLGTTGASFIHHFGSVTQNAVKRSGDTNPYAAENRAYFQRKWKLGWWRRFWLRRRLKWRDAVWRTKESTLYGHSLVEKWIDGRLRYY